MRESLNLLFREWQFFGSIIIGPVLIITGASLAARVATQKTAETYLAMMTYVVLTFSWVRLAVCCHRFILLGEQPNSFIERCRWQGRDTWFAFYGIAIYIFAWFFIFLAALGTSALSPWLALFPNWLLLFVFGIGSIVMWLLFSYLMGRLSLVLPATAIDRRPAKEWMDWAWSKSEGNEWPLMFLMGVNPSIGWIMLHATTDSMIKYGNENPVLLALPIYGLAWTFYFFATIFQVAVLSFSLKHLLDNKPNDNSLEVA